MSSKRELSLLSFKTMLINIDRQIKHSSGEIDSVVSKLHKDYERLAKNRNKHQEEEIKALIDEIIEINESVD